MKKSKNFIKTFEEFSAEAPVGIPQEGKKLRKRKPGDNIYLDPDIQNPANQTAANDGAASGKYPFGGI
jgi:hypothetical protein